MNLLTKSLISELVGDNIVTALYGGGFKPPTKGHFEVVQKALTEFPEIDKFIVYVGSGERNGITQAESLLIWEIYKKYLGDKVEIQPSKAPIGDIIRYGKSHPEEVVYFVIGARDGNEGDLQDVALRTSGVEDKYPNVKIKVIQTPDAGISGTKAREASKKSPEAFYKFLPSVINDNERLEIFGYIQDVVTEIVTDTEVICDNCGWEWSIADGGDDLYMCHKCGHDNNPKQLNENASYSSDINVKEKILELTKHMLAKGMNIKPLPKVKFVNGDSDNAREFLGKTAYYDPNNFTITLYTEGRHPKDIVRSFSHEMIHHIQNLENRLGDVSTTNTMEDDNIDKLEQEANLKGTMTFRNWTDSLNEIKNKDPFGLLEGLLNEGRYDKITRELTDITINAWKDDEKSGEPIGRVEFEVGPGKDFEYGDLEFIYRGIAVFANIYQYRHNGSATPDKGMVEVDFYIPRSELPKMWEKIYFDLISVIRHEIEHLTQSGKNVKSGKEMGSDRSIRKWLRLHQSSNKGTEYYKLEKEIDANLQGLYLKAKKTRTPFSKVVDDYLKYDVKLSSSQIEDVKNTWRPRLKALSLPLLETKYKLKQVMNEEETEQTYTIYCDMDGVLVDFDKGYKALTGKETTHVDVQGKNEFWGTFKNGLEGRKMSEKDYWANLQWMPDGKDLWNHIKQYKPTLLSAPSRDPQSRWGKRIWVKKHIPGTPLILAYAASKKNYANKNAILIDDRISNINDWNAAGGIGILHTSTETTLEKLSKYGI